MHLSRLQCTLRTHLGAEVQDEGHQAEDDHQECHRGTNGKADGQGVADLKWRQRWRY